MSSIPPFCCSMFFRAENRLLRLWKKRHVMPCCTTPMGPLVRQWSGGWYLGCLLLGSLRVVKGVWVGWVVRYWKASKQRKNAHLWHFLVVAICCPPWPHWRLICFADGLQNPRRGSTRSGRRSQSFTTKLKTMASTGPRTSNGRVGRSEKNVSVLFAFAGIFWGWSDRKRLVYILYIAEFWRNLGKMMLG